ncbi:MAG: D-glycero-beta-D-manno-heptose-7-phosphate kinase [Selenomonadaceae bacterium]|nr:D-glycero-beta-D-manno-heptose-7-phosphate kinase [Selenomonadaceae bacterium]
MFDLSYFDNVNKLRVLVTGDIMLDKFYFAKMSKFSSDAPIPVAKVLKRTASPGGAANVARCLANLGSFPSLVGFVGSDHNCESLMELLITHKIDTSGIVFTDRPTHTKVRVIAQNHQVFRLDFDDETAYSDALFDRLTSYIHNRLNHSLDAIVLADYEKGVCTEHFCQAIISDAHDHGCPIIVLPYGSNWIKYQHADFIVPNISKMNRILLSPIDAANDDACASAANYVRRKFNIRSCLATRSGFGATLATQNLTSHFTTKQQLLVDPAGAADAACAASTLAIAKGSSLNTAAKFSNLVAGIAVSQPGSYAPTINDVVSC